MVIKVTCACWLNIFTFKPPPEKKKAPTLARGDKPLGTGAYSPGLRGVRGNLGYPTSQGGPFKEEEADDTYS